jgi:hypothetical protein
MTKILTPEQTAFEVAWQALMSEQRRPWDRAIRRVVHAFWHWWLRTRPG